MTQPQWKLPSLPDVLDSTPPNSKTPNILRQKNIIEKTLGDLGFTVKVGQIQQGPQITQFSLLAEADSQPFKIKKVEQDLALALSGVDVRIVLPAPQQPFMAVLVPHPAGEISVVSLRQLLESPAFVQHHGPLKVGLGLNLTGQPVIIDLVELPHLLLAGTTGSGKSSCLHTIIASLLCTYPPNTLHFLMIDPLSVELKIYNGLPHLFAPVVTRSAQALDTLGTLEKVIERRYQVFADNHARNISAYNQKLSEAGKDTIPYIVIVIDNVFDLLMSSANEVEKIITRMAQRARGAGVHLILSTPHANTSALSGSLKANFPGRIAFKVMNPAESRLILDQNGAEDLLGQGDLLFKASGGVAPQRVQGVYVSEVERERILDFWR